MKLNNLIAFVLISIPLLTAAQFSEPKIKLKNEEKYLYPINPGQPGSLAGNMGELRTTHFHSGIDIRTNNVIGLQVKASKSGYVSRAIISTSGYGNVLYVTHPDGNTTLYAHLSELSGAVAKHILQERYTRKTSEIDLAFLKGQFPVKQGEVIALSGNTGGSTGPHLHFDIRDSLNNALNPLQFGFDEIVDNLPPAAEKIALQTLDVNARINDRSGRFEFYAQRAGNNYILAQPIMAHGNIGVEILAKDKFTAKSAFYGGVNYLEMHLDSQRVFKQAIEKLDVAETRDIFTLTSFKTMRTKGTRFYKLYVDDGNDLKFYEDSPGNGKINIHGTQDALVNVTMKDSYGNSSTASFQLRPTPVVKEVKTLEPLTPNIVYDITENVLMVTAKPCSDSIKTAQVYSKGAVKEKTADYYNLYRSIYLFDLRKEIPDSVVVCGNAITPKIKAMIPAYVEYKYYDDGMDIQFPANALYDTLYLNTSHVVKPNGTEVYTIGDRINPLRKAIRVSVKPALPVTWTKGMAMYRINGKGFTYLGGEQVNDKIQFNTREFGEFMLLNDNIAPTIKMIYANNQDVRLKIKDNLSGISSFEANINGQWLLMNYDYKTGIIWSEKLDSKIPLKGKLEVTVTDNVGNKNTFTTKIL